MREEHRIPTIELLEERNLLSAMLLRDLNDVATADQAPTNIASVNGRLVLAAHDRRTGRELFAVDPVTGVHTLLRDFAVGVDSASLGHFTPFDGALFFFAGSENNAGLWKTDGTAAGTVLVRDVRPPGTYGAIQQMAVAGPWLYLIIHDGVNGEQLWKSDGTMAGTVIIRNSSAGGPQSPRGLTPLGGTMYFGATSAAAGDELWKSNGTAAGTVQVKDIFVGSTGSNPASFAVANGTLYFAAESVASGRELFKSDGTAAGTVVVKEIGVGPIGGNPDFATTVNGTLFFTAQTQAAGRELWKSDGTSAGTGMVVDLWPGSNVSGPEDLTAFGDTLLFTAPDVSGDVSLYRSNGTAAGTTDLSHFSSQRVFSPIVIHEGTAYFFEEEQFGGVPRLWRTDGTALGTYVLRGFGGSRNYSRLFSSPDGLFFGAVGDEASEAVWRTDGSVAGTNRFAVIDGSNQGSEPRAYARLGEGTVFIGIGGPTGAVLAFTDGTATGTQKLRDIRNESASPPNYELTVVGTNAFFVEYRFDGTVELWKTDGTVAGTVLVKQASDFNASRLVSYGGRLYFLGRDLAHGSELWTSDGTAAGTVRVTDVAAGTNSFVITAPTVANGLLMFYGRDFASNDGLWASDGTAAGTRLVKRVAASRLVEHQGTLLFVGSVSEHGQELWRSDGTEAGTMLVRDIREGTAGSAIGPWIRHGERLLFTAFDQSFGTELWRTDGTLDGTYRVIDLNPGSGSSQFYGTTSVQGQVLALYNKFPDGPGYALSLAKIDEATATAVEVREFGGGGPAGPMIESNGVAYFAASDTGSDVELWQSDGSLQGTYRVADIAPGAQGSSPSALFGTRQYVIFSADDGYLGAEPYAAPDEYAPRVLSASFGVDEPGIHFTLNETVADSLDDDDVVIRNITTGEFLSNAEYAVLGAAESRIIVHLTAPVQNGDYTVRLRAIGVSDSSGNQLLTDHQTDFFILAGDANRDRSVNIDDFGILASRFNLLGTFSQGDFNYSGTADIDDFGILASKFNTSLPAARGVVVAGGVEDGMRASAAERGVERLGERPGQALLQGGVRRPGFAGSRVIRVVDESDVGGVLA